MCLFFSDGLIDWSSTKHHKWESSFVCMCRYICATYCIQLMLYDAELLRQWGYWWGENILGWYFKNYIRNQLTLRELGIHKLCGPNGLLWFGDNFITNSKSIQTIPKIPTLLVYRTDGDLYIETLQLPLLCFRHWTGRCHLRIILWRLGQCLSVSC